MKPRVFVSSTYFDLKHVRERLERFIENYYFDPVLFESDTVTFEHNKPLDISCYNEVKLCHMMILIVGGRYGSIISGENIKEKKDFYNNDYISITRKEFETAAKLNIPIFIFIEKNVYAEYHTYNKNKNLFDKENKELESFAFAHVDDINVFKFINIIKGNAIKTFEKIEDIENYLGNQIAGMLYLYLEKLQDNKEEETLLDSVSELKSISKRMNEMLLAVGKNVIQDDSSFAKVIFEQNKILIEFFVDQVIDNIGAKSDLDISSEKTLKVYEIFKDVILNFETISSIERESDYFKKQIKRTEIEEKFKKEILTVDSRLQIEYLNYFKICDSYRKKIYPIILNNPELQNFLDSKLSYELELLITGLPF
ncbi:MULTISPECIES: DUF4062 domain-containing protein [Flavobacterium]|uniref:DUF4062 domain-containing protein n=1 Tax=Flavobacterium TaxID=237 RepID=UPI002114EE6F|nr:MULTISPECIES: DUF4062 domain-containing protein [Flavobacterium]UUF13888.1 DUF4062 domain-containing protein [Flavobacterium panici]